MKGPAAKGKILAEIFAGIALGHYEIFRNQASRSLQETAIAVEIFKRVNGQYPGSLTQLVPDFLPRLYLDPYSGKGLVYQATKNDFILYSVYHNQADDGGEEYFDLLFERPFQDLVEYIEWENKKIVGLVSVRLAKYGFWG